MPMPKFLQPHTIEKKCSQVMSPRQQDIAMQDDWDEGDLSDGQVKSLLQRAEQRIRKTESTEKQITEVSRYAAAFEILSLQY